MSEGSIRLTVRFLAGVFLVVGALVGPAISQEEGAADPVASSVEDPGQRTGVWVDFFFGTDIDKEKRTVIGEGKVFPADGNRIYCLTRVHGMSPPAKVTHAWYHEGITKARVDLTVGSENWRTWSYKSYPPAWTGSWEVKVLDEDGMVLGSAGFEVK